MVRMNRFAVLLVVVMAGTTSAKPQDTPKQVRVTGAQIVGASSLTDAELEQLRLRAMGTSERKDWARRLERELTQIVADFGFAFAKVAVSPDRDSPFDATTIRVSVQEGSRYKVGSVWWSGESSLSLTELGDMTVLKQGDLLKPSVLFAASARIREACAHKGFQKASVIPQFELRPENQASIYIQILDCSSEFRNSKTEPLHCSVGHNSSPAHFPLVGYDPKRDATADLADAESEAQRSQRKILILVGGQWCSWCKLLGQSFDFNLAHERDRMFVTLTINYSDENKNECALKSFPQATAYPTVYVLDADGTVLTTDDTTAWQFGGSYDKSRIASFLERWGERKPNER
jgi:hypothetical protein